MMPWKFLVPKMIKTYDNISSTILMVLFTHMNESWVWLSWFQYSVLVWLSNDPQRSYVKDLVPTLVLLKDDRNVRGGALSAGLCFKGIVDSGYFFLHPGLNVPWCHHEIQPHTGPKATGPRPCGRKPPKQTSCLYMLINCRICYRDRRLLMHAEVKRINAFFQVITTFPYMIH